MVLIKFLVYTTATIASIVSINAAPKIIYKFANSKQQAAINTLKSAPDSIAIANDVLTRTANFKKYCKQHNMDTSVGFMLNMHLPSNTNRFFMVNLNSGKIIHSGLVAHGSGSGTGFIPTKFSNVENSLATSLGHYKIGERYMGKFGLAYKLHGLDATNNNAYARAVVLHAHECVPEEPVLYSICESWGCPTTATNFLKLCDAQIKAKAQPLGLWIYY